MALRKHGRVRASAEHVSSSVPAQNFTRNSSQIKALFFTEYYWSYWKKKANVLKFWGWKQSALCQFSVSGTETCLTWKLILKEQNSVPIKKY
jgi:hypothetical protein